MALELRGPAALSAPLLRDRCKAGVLLDAFLDSGAYTASSSGVLANNAPAADGMKITTSGASSNTQASADLGVDLSKGFLSFEIRTDANFNRLVVGLSCGASDFSKRYEPQVKASSQVEAGKWHRVTVAVHTTTNGTGVTAADLADVRNIRFELHSTSGGAASMDIRDLRWHPWPYPNGAKAGILMVFDDGLAAHYTEAFRVMRPLGLVGSVGVISASVGTTGYATLSQLQEMQAAGWEHSAHGPTGLSGQSASAQRTAMRAARDYLTANGMPGGRGFFAYPGGSWDATTLREARRIFGACRIAGSQNLETPVVSDLHLLKPWYVTNSTSLATMTDAIDKLAARGGLMILTFHNIVPSVSATEDISIANFEALMAYVAASGVRTYRPSEVFDLSARYGG